MGKPDEKDKKRESKDKGKGAKDEKGKDSLHAPTSKTPSPKVEDSRSQAPSKMANPSSPPKPPSSKPPDPSPGHPVGESKPGPKPPSSPPTPAKPSPSAESSTAPSTPKPASPPHPDPSPGKPASSAESSTAPSTPSDESKDKDKDKDKGAEPASPTPSSTPPAPSPADSTPKPAGAPTPSTSATTPPSTAKEDAAAPKATPAPAPAAPATAPQPTDTRQTPSSTTAATVAAAAADAAQEKKRGGLIGFDESLSKRLAIWETSGIGKEPLKALARVTYTSAWFIWIPVIMFTTQQPSLREQLVNLFRGIVLTSVVCMIVRFISKRERPSRVGGTPPTPLTPGVDLYSFPSGSCALTMLTCRFLTVNYSDGVVTALAAILVILVAVAALALGRHYVLDVLGGWAIGLVIFCVSKRMWMPAEQCERFVKRLHEALHL